LKEIIEGKNMIKVVTQENIQDISIRYIKGVGEKRAALLSSIGLDTVRSALLFFPRRYEDRTVIKKISECMTDETCTVLAKLISDIEIRRYSNIKCLMRASFKDDTGVMTVNWFNAPYIKKMLIRHSTYSLYGKIAAGKNGICLNNPAITQLREGEDLKMDILPVYPLTKSIRQFEIRKIISKSVEIYKNKLAETLPEGIIKKRELLDINSSYISIHRPQSIFDYETSRKRLVYEELFYLQLSLLSIKSESESALKERKYVNNDEIRRFISNIPFKLTDSQQKATYEILDDLDSDRIMNRLLQGDVGSGKTVIAVCSALKACLSSFQVAVMVPTSILAMQHYETFSSLLGDYGIRIGLLYSGIKGKAKKDIIEGIRSGDIGIIIGTHSLIREDVEFSNLGLVITDEQHRFGVNQRFSLISKAKEPDKLVMTATPIPRTLGLIIYGDTDISVINELPPGRKKVETYAVDESKRERIFEFIRKNITDGRQVYIICPLIEDSKLVDAQSVTEYTAKIRSYFPDIRISSLHGKMKVEEKEKILFEFTKGMTDILVSTTVIEIGINIPNANIILVENAERYGLAQLHQLRGRVGRGEHQSYCILVSDAKNELTRKRINILAGSNDGFYIAEMDLQLRGPGDFFGTMQHGLPEMRIANLYEDIGILKDVQDDIKAIKKGDLVISVKEKAILQSIINEMKEDIINA
jgi:ATP-dependent DNA helicase RecG